MAVLLVLFALLWPNLQEFLAGKGKTLAEICGSSKIKVEDLLQEFFQWIVQDKEAAARWLQGEDAKEGVNMGRQENIEIFEDTVYVYNRKQKQRENHSNK